MSELQQNIDSVTPPAANAEGGAKCSRFLAIIIQSFEGRLNQPYYLAFMEEDINGTAVADIHKLDMDKNGTLVLIANRNARNEMEEIANELGYKNIIIVDWIYKMIMW